MKIQASCILALLLCSVVSGEDAARLYPLIRNADGTDKVNPRVRVSAIGSSDGEKVGPLTTPKFRSSAMPNPRSVV